jgi:hypothetical protein
MDAPGCLQFSMMKNILLILLLAALSFATPVSVHALDEGGMPTMEEFIADLVNGDPEDLRGIYAPEVMAYEIQPQPRGNPAHVTLDHDALTLFGMAAEYETVGLLAHNYLAGSDFFQLEHGQLFHLIYGDGRTETFIARHVWRYQALSPNSVMSDFVDLETGELLSASQLFLKVYNRPGDIALQTCIYRDGDPSWGRLFIIAEPYEEPEPRSMPGYLLFQ